MIIPMSERLTNLNLLIYDRKLVTPLGADIHSQTVSSYKNATNQPISTTAVPIIVDARQSMDLAATLALCQLVLCYYSLRLSICTTDPLNRFKCIG